MVKNKLEKMFSKSCRFDNTIWFMKLHNNPLSHQTTPADYMITYIKHHKELIANLLECKQVTCKEGKGRLAFKRLKQLHDMLSFEKKFPTFHKAYFCIAFYDTNWSKSDIYIIPVKDMELFIHQSEKVSANRRDMQTYFYDEKVKINKGVIDIWSKLQ